MLVRETKIDQNRRETTYTADVCGFSEVVHKTMVTHKAVYEILYRITIKMITERS